MNFIPRSIIGFTMFAILIGCSTANSTSNPTPILSQFSQSTPDIGAQANLQTATKAAWPSFTPHPSQTLDLTQTAIRQDQSTTQAAEQTLVAQYPRVCDDTYAPPGFSPTGSWMEEFCYSEEDQSPILTLSNKDTQILWKLVYRDFIQQGEFLPDGGLAVVYWPNDNRYVYFNSYVSGSGGECFVTGTVLNYGKGLFRLDLETGSITVILPLRENFVGYDFSFSLTGRRMVYENNMGSLNILDLNSGQALIVVLVSELDGMGGYLWSPDGLQFVYSTVVYNEISEPTAYSLRVVNAQSGSEQILIESQENCFAAIAWTKDDILTIEKYDKNYDRSLIEYDLNSNQVISEATATPHP